MVDFPFQIFFPKRALALNLQRFEIGMKLKYRTNDASDGFVKIRKAACRNFYSNVMSFCESRQHSTAT